MSIKNAQRRERIRRLLTENWPMKLFAAVLITGFVVGGCSYFGKDKTAVMDAERQQAEIIKDRRVAQQAQEIIELKIQLAAKTSPDINNRSDLVRLIEEKDARIAELEARIIATPVAGEVNEIRREFVRDESVRLVDQANNVGGLIWGPRAVRYGSRSESGGHAVFSERVHGDAALIDLILAHQGSTVRDYLLGGGNVLPHHSYTGGKASEKVQKEYLAVMAQHGIGANEKIYIGIEFLLMMVRGHAQMEGSKRNIELSDIQKAFIYRDDVITSSAAR